MRILYRDSKSGETKLHVENLDDLWHIYNIIERGDLVSALTYRRFETRMFKDKLRTERGEKKKMWLGVRVEKVQFHEFSDRVRISGKIEAGPQDIGQHHTFNIEVSDTINILKPDWREEHLQRIKEAVDSAARPQITFLAIEGGEATFAVLRHYGVQQISTVTTHLSGKLYEEDRSEKEKFYESILSELRRVMKGGVLIVVGPGFTKEDFCQYGRKKEQSLFSNCIIQTAGHGGMVGIYEAFKTGVGGRLLEESRVGYETKLIEQLLAEIAKGGKCAYGPDEVRNALEAGAVETLLVADVLVRERKMEEALRKAEKGRAKVVVISSVHESGKKLEGLGGIAALLRFRMG